MRAYHVEICTQRQKRPAANGCNIYPASPPAVCISFPCHLASAPWLWKRGWKSRNACGSWGHSAQAVCRPRLHTHTHTEILISSKIAHNLLTELQPNTLSSYFNCVTFRFFTFTIMDLEACYSETCASFTWGNIFYYLIYFTVRFLVWYKMVGETLCCSLLVLF